MKKTILLAVLVAMLGLGLLGCKGQAKEEAQAEAGAEVTATANVTANAEMK